MYFLILLFAISIGVGQPSLALILGMSTSLIFGNSHITRTQKETKRLLPLSVVLLGAGLRIDAVIKTGVEGAFGTFASLMMVFLVGIILAKLWKIPRRLAGLVTFGTAICGGSAIAAASPVLRAREDETAVALISVFVLNAVALLIFPPIGHFLNMSPDTFGWWAALAIHDTSSVVGAASAYGEQALQVATTVKLTRALWILPCVLIASLPVVNQHLVGSSVSADSKKITRPPFPRFIIGFLLMSFIFSILPTEYAQTGEWVQWAGRRLLVGVLFLIGATLTRERLRSLGWQTFGFALSLWGVISIGTLGFLLMFKS